MQAGEPGQGCCHQKSLKVRHSGWRGEERGREEEEERRAERERGLSLVMRECFLQRRQKLARKDCPEGKVTPKISGPQIPRGQWWCDGGDVSLPQRLMHSGCGPQGCDVQK